MSGDSSEEKTLPPSQKKLRDGRKKGQIAKSRDLVSALGLVTAIAFLWTRWDMLNNELREVLLNADRLQNEPFVTAAPQVGAGLVDFAGRTVLPLLAVVASTGLLASVLVNKGFVFSLEPIKPKLENLNPVSGLKRMFGIKALVELGKTLVKALLLGGTLLVVFLGTWNTLVLIPTCGVGCLGFVAGTQTKLLLSIAVAAFLIAGLIDVLIQRWLFLRDMKMSASELKREYKEQEGDPHVRGAHRRHRQESAGLPPLGLKRATLLIRGRGYAVGLRYVASEGGAPLIVCCARGEQADVMTAAAAELGIARIQDHGLASALARKVAPGSALPNRFFDRAARAMHNAGLA
ncbi:EscU/YscU/HrcU family type III secretion system export apparatus switch protein [Methylobacterium brachythecii]|uniref:EscU/YscU/HrcU family type III secretion system export apparatus switch protein n=1 Tax=Methylobacterium brachythecii TaxID=1176177 RepID=A0A7W6AKC7_9HYPH|nr:EscU/YscU/HrcU family type III secretion system export apparatus switch protein [Methylobacterium brachythecii]MBB3903294.1 type III secretion protein U [Methylobacterium brachythecii]GLS46088.1 EscU/YscU/HrcU family type III secretion system export apparatus switch protein [Methylobacterium brachythecii]